MGLDMYAIATKAKFETEVDLDFTNVKITESDDLHYWRKHPNLHGWMRDLYVSKGGKSTDFNGDCVVLTSKDLDNLYQDIIDDELPNTAGFFFGQTDGSEKEDDLKFVADARNAIRNGLTVYYTSSW